MRMYIVLRRVGRNIRNVRNVEEEKKTKEGYLVDEPETMKKKKKVSKG